MMQGVEFARGDIGIVVGQYRDRERPHVQVRIHGTLHQPAYFPNEEERDRFVTALRYLLGVTGNAYPSAKPPGAD